MRHEILFSGYFLILQSFKRVCIFPGKAAAMFKASKNVRASILKNVMKRIISTARNPAKYAFFKHFRKIALRNRKAYAV